MAAARAELRKSGITERVLSKMPAEQIAMLDGLRRIEFLRDESLKWFNLPEYQADAGLAQAESRDRCLTGTWNYSSRNQGNSEQTFSNDI